MSHPVAQGSVHQSAPGVVSILGVHIWTRGHCLFLQAPCDQWFLQAPLHVPRYMQEVGVL